MKIRSFKNILSFLFIGFVISSCQGKFSFRMINCAEGLVKVGGQCVSPDSAKANCKDFDLSKVLKGETIVRCDGSLAEGTYVAPSDCKTDGEQNCIPKSKFKALDVSKLTSDKIIFGESVFGVTGTTRKVKACRNYASLTSYDASYPPGNFGGGLSSGMSFTPANVTVATDLITMTFAHGLLNNTPLKFTSSGTMPAPLVAETTYYAIYVSATTFRVAAVPNGSQIDITSQGTVTHFAKDVSDGSIQYYDTIDDWNGFESDYPKDNPWSTTQYLCDSTTFVDVTSTAAPLLPSGAIPATANVAFTKIWQDQLTGLYITNALYDAIPNNRTYTDALRTCESINGGTAGDGWRLPTQKELMQIYINGGGRLLGGGSGYWSSSAQATAGNMPWMVNILDGTTNNVFTFMTGYRALCVR